jgi:hypothetical protein
VVPPSNPENPWRGVIPINPIMDTQLDDIIIRDSLIPLRTALLKGLKRRIEEKKREHWFEIYLTIFIIMCNFEWIWTDAMDYTTRYGLKPTITGEPSLTRIYIHACKTLLSYFHFAYNGTAPLRIDWRQPQNATDILSLEQLIYVQGIQDELSRQEPKLDGLKDLSMYRTEMYWCFQVLSKDWRSDLAHIGEIDEFTEEDFIL